jgi:CRISPR-associated protein (TIGR03986 family)
MFQLNKKEEIMSDKYNHKTAGTFRATAPYNFVPLPEKVFTEFDDEKNQEVNDRYYENRHTGHIVLKIKTETPFYTRCAIPPVVFENPNNFDDKGKLKISAIRDCQDFFHRGQKEGNDFIPVIPGSSFRGMTRSFVEILSYSKMLSVVDKELIHRSVGESTAHGVTYRKRVSLGKVKAGYLLKKSNGFFINPAKPNKKSESFVRVKMRDNFNEVFEGYISLSGYDDRGRSVHTFSNTLTTTETEKVTILNTGEITLKAGASRKSFAIYEKDTSKELEISTKLWDLYEDDYKKSILQSPDLRKLENGEPLFYIEDKSGKIEYFGSTMMFRLLYNPNNCEPHKISDFVPNNLKQDNDENQDLAETIFGYVRQNSQSVRAGRVFFTDAIWEKQCEDEYPFFKRPLEPTDDGRRVPKILASPKPSSFQLYLNQPIIDTTKDKHGNTIQDGSKIKSYYDKNETLIRGTKLYWSKKSLSNAQEDFVDLDTKISSNENGFRVDKFKTDLKGKTFHNGKKGEWIEDSSQHTVIRPVQSETHFESKVYFENLTKLELGVLLTALELPTSKRHRLGMGKPLGLGTIKIETEIFLEQRNKQENDSTKSRYESLFDVENWHIPVKNNTRNIADDCKTYFRQEILKHHNKSVVKPQISDTENGLLDEIPRLKAFFDILGWDNDEVKNEYNIRYLNPETNGDNLRKRHVLPTPKGVLENNNFAFFVETSESQTNQISNQSEVKNQDEKKSESPVAVAVIMPSVPSTLINLPAAKVSNELHQYYQKWEKLEDLEFKVAYGKIILEKGTHWKKSEEKTWFQEVFEFVEKNNK